MKAEWRPPDLDENEKERYWEENVRVVKDLLEKHSTPGCESITLASPLVRPQGYEYQHMVCQGRCGFSTLVLQACAPAGAAIAKDTSVANPPQAIDTAWLTFNPSRYKSNIPWRSEG